MVQVKFGYSDATMTVMQHLGLFIVQYGHLEMAIHQVFYFYSGIRPDLARAIVAGMRLKDIVERLKRILVLRELDPRILTDINEIEALLDKNKLLDFRNEVVHWAWGFSDDGASISSTMSAKTTASTIERKITPEILQEKTREAYLLTQRAFNHITVSREELDLLPDWVRQQTLMRAPWLEKPV